MSAKTKPKRIIGNWSLTKTLGEGGMGKVKTLCGQQPNQNNVIIAIRFVT